MDHSCLFKYIPIFTFLWAYSLLASESVDWYQVFDKGDCGKSTIIGEREREDEYREVRMKFVCSKREADSQEVVIVGGCLINKEQYNKKVKQGKKGTYGKPTNEFIHECLSDQRFRYEGSVLELQINQKRNNDTTKRNSSKKGQSQR